MSKIQSFAVEAPMKDNTRSMEPDKQSGGQIQSFASHAPLSTSPVSAMPWNGGSRNIQTFASHAPLGTTPQKGYESASTPMSKRSIKQSQ